MAKTVKEIFTKSESHPKETGKKVVSAIFQKMQRKGKSWAMQSGTEQTAISDHDLLIRLDTKIDQFLSAQADHELRLRTVESDRDKALGSIRTLKGLSALLLLIATCAGALATWALVGRWSVLMTGWLCGSQAS